MSTNNACMIYLHALTPIHTGIGQAASVIDLPIAREKSTGWPFIPSTSLKGVLRDIKRSEKDIDRIFGSPDNAGAVAFGDQRILCLPIRSYFGTFAYVSSPLCLNRIARDLDLLKIVGPFQSAIPEVNEEDILVTEQSRLMRDGKVYLEDLDLVAKTGSADAIAEGIAKILFQEDAEQFVRRFAIVSDEVFNFLSETAMEVDARIKMNDETKTVSNGGLWYEESVPAEAIFFGPLLLTNIAKKSDGEEILSIFNNSLIQIGGNASVGSGLCRMVVTK